MDENLNYGFKKSIVCNLCNSIDYQRIYTINKFHVSTFNIVKCRNCGLVLMNPQFDEETITNFYNDDSFKGGSEYDYIDERKTLKYRIPLYHERLRQIEKFANKGRILDIGCSFGHFLKIAQERGWVTFGVEIASLPAQYANSQNKLNVFHGTLEDAAFQDNYFDVVSLFDVIEHLQDPFSSLKEIFRILNKKGIVIIATSNFDSLKAKLQRENWKFILPGHLYYFSAKTLTSMLRKTGFTISKFFAGDEISINTKLKTSKLIKTEMLGKNSNLNLDNDPLLNNWGPIKTILVNLLRKIQFGSFTVGGMTVVAKKP